MIAEGLAALAKLLGVADKLAAIFQANQQKAAGKNELLADQNAESAKVNADVAKAAVSTNDDAAVGLLHDGRA